MMRQFLFSILVLFVLIGMLYATTDTIGASTSQTADSTDELHFGVITASDSGILQSVGVNIQTTTGGHVQMGIWDASGNLLCTSASTSMASGWIDPDMSSCSLSIVATNNYYIGWDYDLSAQVYYGSSGISGFYWEAQTYGSMPSTLDFGHANYRNYNMRMTYEAAPTTTTTTTETTTSTSITTTTETTTSTSITTTTSSTASTTSITPVQKVPPVLNLPTADYGSLLPSFFFIFSLILFAVRLVKYDTNGTHWVAIDMLSGLFMFAAMYFYIFTPVGSASTVTVVSGIPSCNALECVNQTEVITSNALITTPQIQVTSYGFILIVTIVVFYIILMVIFAMRDFILRRSSF